MQCTPAPTITHSQTGYYTLTQLQTHTNRPLAVSGQDEVESSVIVGGVVNDLLCVRNADVDCIHYLGGEVSPVKYLQDKSESTDQEEKTNVRKTKDSEKETANSDRWRVYFYLRFNLKGEVGVQITKFHLVVKQHWVVTVLWSISSLEERKTYTLKIRNAVAT